MRLVPLLDIYHLQDFQNAITGVAGGYVVITIDENKQTDCLYILIDSPVLASAKKVYRWNEAGLCYTSGGIEKGTWVKVLNPDGKVNAEALDGACGQLRKTAGILPQGK